LINTPTPKLNIAVHRHTIAAAQERFALRRADVFCITDLLIFASTSVFLNLFLLYYFRGIASLLKPYNELSEEGFFLTRNVRTINKTNRVARKPHAGIFL
jgi:hypothetical protein